MSQCLPYLGFAILESVGQNPLMLIEPRRTDVCKVTHSMIVSFNLEISKVDSIRMINFGDVRCAQPYPALTYTFRGAIQVLK